MQPGPAFVGASSCLPFDTSQFWSLPPGSQPRSANLWHDSIGVSHVVTHPPQSRLSLMAEHQVAVFGSASLRKSIQVSEPAVEMGKRKSLYASLKQWHFLSQWTKTSSSFLFFSGIFFGRNSEHYSKKSAATICWRMYSVRKGIYTSRSLK